MILKAKEMQPTEEENQAKFRSDEESINFRPSPNFKLMKKYLKVHKEEANFSSGDSNSSSVEANSSSVEANSSPSEVNSSRGEDNFSIGEAKTSSLGHNKLEKVNKTAIMATAAVQPPLPPNPPPPDTPPMIIKVKQEVEDDKYNCSTIETSSVVEHSNELVATAAPIKTHHSEEKQGLTMCRNFARGTCKKGAACIFAHELILSQLPGVYTFCRNFQNSVCSFPKCKFVHATVFEKEHFFRTGYLPPHTLAHLQEASVVHAPPPPPQPEGTPVALPPVYSDAAPAPSIPCVPAVVQYNAVAGPEMMHNAVADPNIFNTLHSVITTSPKSEWREWSENDEASSTTRVLDSGEPLAKKCKNCDHNELRETLLKAQVEEAARSTREIVQRTEAACRKNSMISELLQIFQAKDMPAAGGPWFHSPNTDENLVFNMFGGSSRNPLISVLATLLRNEKSVFKSDNL